MNVESAFQIRRHMKTRTNHEIAYAILNKPEKLGRVLLEARYLGKLGLIVKSTKVNNKGNYDDTNSKTK